MRLPILAAILAMAAGSPALPVGAGFLPVGTEITEQRDACARHYSNGDGTITAVISARPEGETDIERTAETFEYTYATGHCAHDGSQYGKTDWGLVKVEKEVVLYPPSATERVGWFKFNLASIPDSATITWARCRFIVTYFEMSMGLRFTCLGVDPVPTGAQALYNAIYEGEVCAMGDMPRAVDSFDLGPIAAAHIQRSLSRDWVAFGLVGYNYSNIMSKRGWIIGWNTSPRENAPQLRVVYDPPSGVAELGPVPLLPALTIAPNPVTGRVVNLKARGFEGSGGRVTLHDVMGRSVLSRPLVIGNWSLDIPLDPRQVPAGVYLIRLESGGHAASARLIVR